MSLIIKKNQTVKMARIVLMRAYSSFSPNTCAEKISEAALNKDATRPREQTVVS